MTSQPPPSGPPSEPPYGPPSGPPSGPLAGPPSGGGSAGPPSVPPPPSGPPGGPPSGGAGGRPRTPWWRSGKGLALAAGTLVVAVVATVLIVNNQSSHNEAIPAANEVALQAPSDPGPAPFTPSVETQGVSAPAPATTPAQQPGGATSKVSTPAALHSVEGSSAGLYGGNMGKSSCDTERLIGMVSGGDTGRAWASGAGIGQADIPAYLRSLTPTYLRVDTRVTNHSYKSGAVVEYQSALQAGTAVLVDSHGVPRVRCACGNPLQPAKLVSNAKYTGKAWSGFQPTTLVVVVPAPQPMTEIVLVNFETGGWFARLTGRIEIVDKHVEPPKGPLVPGIPPAEPWKPSTPSGKTTTSGTATSGSTTSGSTTSGSTTSGSTTSGSTTSGSTTSGSTTSGSTTSGSTTSSGGPSSSSATSSTSSGTPSETKATTSTSTGTTTSAGSTTSTSKPTVTSSAASTTTSPKTPTATCATTSPSTLPPCPTTVTAAPS